MEIFSFGFQFCKGFVHEERRWQSPSLRHPSIAGPGPFQQQRAFLRTVRTKWNIADCGNQGTQSAKDEFFALHVWIVDGETEEPVGEEIFLEEATKEVKATAVKSIRDAVQMFKPSETPRAESQK